MPSKKIKFGTDEESIFNDALIYKRGEYWQFRIWLTNEHKYARFSLKTRNRATAIDKAKLHYHELKVLQLQGKSYFSITTKEGVRRYLEQKWKDRAGPFGLNTGIAFLNGIPACFMLPV